LRETSIKKAARGGRKRFCWNIGPDVSSFHGIVCRSQEEKRREKYHNFTDFTKEKKM
jgi:hypothetical protein